MSSYSRPMRFASAVVLFFFMWSFGGLRDIAWAAQNGGLKSPKAVNGRHFAKREFTKKKRTEEELETTLHDIEDHARDLKREKSKSRRRSVKKALQRKRRELKAQSDELRKEFARTRKHLRDGKISEAKLKVHREFVEQYEAEVAELNKRLDAIEQAKTEGDEDREVEKFETYIKSRKKEKKRPRIDFNNLPHRNAEPTKAKPRKKKEEFEPVKKASFTPEQGYAMLFPEKELQEDGYHPPEAVEPVKLAALGLTDNPESFSIPEVPNNLSSDFSPLSSVQLAQASGLPTPDDLAETIEVQFTPAIQAKAAELNHDPLQIYEWVRNNIEFAPSWGSIQGADYCLQTEVCNSFDTASLLIALLRASNVPARYAMGTIELPIEQAMNWAGDFTDPAAALKFMSGGGIPTASVVEGGKITRAQLEHVWVEAWIDYIPSRGARHRTGKGDTWISLDASFKQHTYTQGIDIADAVPFDAQSFVDQLTATATTNEQLGSVTGVDSLFVQQTMTDFQTQVETYINTNYPNATVGDILGTKEIIPENYPYLLGTLPYKQVVVGTSFAEIPDNLRHRWSMDIQGVAPISYSASLPELAGKKITLGYSPATQADEDLIASYLPAPHADGTPILPEELPSSLPAYLINLKPELRIDGVVVAEGGPVTMGTTEDFFMTMSFPGKSAMPVHNIIEAGDYAGIALDLGRISQQHLQAVQDRLANTKRQLELQDLNGLSKDELLGDLLYTTALAYYAEYDVLDYMAARTMRMNNLRLPSESMFSNDLKITNSFWGVPMSAEPGGLVMDVDYNTVVAEAPDGSHAAMIQFMRSTGIMSSILEHVLPEQLFSTPSVNVEGVSTVKALQLANEQSINTYKIDSTNISSILPILQLESDVIADIQGAAAAGKEVIVSESNVIFNSWVGCGYIIFDPDTGAGIYMISGRLGGSESKEKNIENPQKDDPVERIRLLVSTWGKGNTFFEEYIKREIPEFLDYFKVVNDTVGNALDALLTIIDIIKISNNSELTQGQKNFNYLLIASTTLLGVILTTVAGSFIASFTLGAISTICLTLIAAAVIGLMCDLIKSFGSTIINKQIVLLRRRVLLWT